MRLRSKMGEHANLLHLVDRQGTAEQGGESSGVRRGGEEEVSPCEFSKREVRFGASTGRPEVTKPPKGGAGELSGTLFSLLPSFPSFLPQSLHLSLHLSLPPSLHPCIYPSLPPSLPPSLLSSTPIYCMATLPVCLNSTSPLPSTRFLRGCALCHRLANLYPLCGSVNSLSERGSGVGKAWCGTCLDTHGNSPPQAIAGSTPHTARGEDGRWEGGGGG